MSRKWLRLLLICLGLWFFFACLTPFLEDRIPAWKRFNQIQEEQGLDAGALYYSNVPQTQDSEAATRRAIEEAMRERLAKKRARQE